MVVVFTANRREHSFKENKKLNYKLDLLCKGYRSADPPEQQEVAITLLFLRETCNRASNKKEKYLALLYIIDFFFTVWSCEYLVTQEPRKTTNICMKDITFRNQRRGRIDQHSPRIFTAAAISINF